MTRALDVHLAEYDSLRTELIKRMEIGFQAVAYALTIISAVLTIVGYINRQQLIQIIVSERAFAWSPHRCTVAASILVFVPFVSSPIGCILMEQIIMIHSIGHYLDTSLRPRMYQAGASDLILGWGAEHPFSPIQGRIAFYCGSWWIFSVMTFAPTVIVILAAFDHFTLFLCFLAIVDFLFAAVFSVMTLWTAPHVKRYWMLWNR